MDSTKVKLINSNNEEETFVIPEMKKGDPFPSVLVRCGHRNKEGNLMGNQIFVTDETEIRKRFWIEVVYRETNAKFI